MASPSHSERSDVSLDEYDEEGSPNYYLPRLNDASRLDIEVDRISPTDDASFKKALQTRMIEIFRARAVEFKLVEIEKQDTTCHNEPNEELWGKDLEMCQTTGDEAFFRHTLMPSMIDRKRMYYSSLAFGFQKEWTCTPIPTHAEGFLAFPKPDMAFGFRRDKLFEASDWFAFPRETQKLICYEGILPPEKERAFFFMAIETTQWTKGVNDPVALNKCLNDASQALHNMYEFFKEADREIEEGIQVKGRKYTDMFFERVRFFSVVAVAGALKIRIHYACDRDEDDEEGPEKDYPLKFGFSDYKVIQDEEFTHLNAMEELNKILYQYGVNELQGLLKAAIKKMDKRFTAYCEQNGRVLSRGPLFYSYTENAASMGHCVSSILGPNQTTTRVSQTPAPAEITLGQLMASCTLSEAQETAGGSMSSEPYRECDFSLQNAERPAKRRRI